jgi:hypothetical protein
MPPTPAATPAPTPGPAGSAPPPVSRRRRPPVTPARLPGEPEAIFVVGVSRSGTTLMRRVLGRHSRIAIADENHYLGHLIPGQGVRSEVRRAGSLEDDANVRRLVERLYSPEYQRGSRLREASPFWRWLVTRVPQGDLEQRILAGERSERGVFTAVLQAYADRRRRPIYGEKTPAHLRWADVLLEWYPASRVVQMIRDPRAVYVSELKRRVARPESLPYRWLVHVPVVMRWFVLLEVAWAWSDAVAHHRALARRYPDRYRLVRFEDLVRSPQSEIETLCAFLGVAFEPRMLEQKVVSRGDRLGEPGFDAGAADRWRERISPRQAAWLRRLLGRRLEQLGYPRT